MTLRPWLRLLAAALLLAGAAAALLRAVEIRLDMAEFLPPARTEAGAFLLGELRGGAATSLVLAAIEGAPVPELARLSHALAAALRASGRVGLVANGPADLPEDERDLLFRHRYLLSPVVEPALFETPALHARLEALLDGLRSSAAPLLRQVGFADPVGAFAALAARWLGPARIELQEGVWIAQRPEGPRALLVARIAGQGLDVAAQRAVLDVLRQGFAAAGPGPARLLLGGPGLLSAEAAAVVRADVQLVSLVSGLLIAGFLLWRYRSLLMLAAVAVPLAAGALAGAAATALAFGHLHAAALGFGMTMLGVAVDYPILLVSQRRPGESAAAAARRIWPSLRLAAAAAAAGMTAMLGSGFPGLQQLGLFAAAGLLGAALATRFLLPALLGEAGIATRPLPAGLERALLALPRARAAALALPLLALAGLATAGGPRWERDLGAISPVPEAARRLDGELRADLGAPDVRLLAAFRAPDAEAALQGAERVAALLAPLVAAGLVGEIDHPARWLPSAATQRARQAALPEDALLRARMAEAMAGLPFRATAFDRFLADVAASRHLAPLLPESLGAAPVLRARLEPLLAPRGGAWQALILPSDVRDMAALRAALRAIEEPGLLAVEVKPETEALVAAATSRALVWCGVGGVLVLGLLAAGLGGIGPALRTVLPLGAALGLTVALLALLGEKLMLFHLVALLLLAGVGMDYALFLGRAGTEAPEGRLRALRSVFNCTLTTLLTFGLLALCSTPLLRSIGLTVAIGVVAAFLLAAALAPRPAPR